MAGIEGWNNGTAWEAYNESLKKLWVQDNYPSAWNVLNAKEMGAEEAFQLVPTGESAYGYKNYANGATATWYSNYSSTVEYVPDTVSQLNSNAGAGRTQTNWYQSPADTDFSGGSGGGGFNATDIKTGSGASFTGFLQNTVTPAVAAAGLGIKLGKAIDSTLYNLNPAFWDNHGLSSLNPETWNGITMDMSDSGWEGVLKRGFNAIFGLNPNTGTSQMYIDQDAAAYLAMYMDQQGVFEEPHDEHRLADTSPLHHPNLAQPVPTFSPNLTIYKSIWDIPYKDEYTATCDACTYLYKGQSGGRDVVGPVYWDTEPFSYRYTETNLNTGRVSPDVTEQGLQRSPYYIGDSSYLQYADEFGSTGYNPQVTVTDTNDLIWDLAYIYYNGTTTHVGVDGMPDQQGAIKPDFTGCSTLADYLQALQNQYPDMFQNAITQKVAQPDGTTVTHKYVPVGTPTGTENQTTTNPNTTGQSQVNITVDTKTASDELLGTLVKILVKNYTPTGTPTDTKNPPDTGQGDTPVPVVPTGNASSLFAIYNPTQGELNSFGGWLWSSNFVDQLLKLFNDPMQAIIGLHKIFAPPSIGGRQNIYVGYLDSGVASNTVSNQYTTINCGSVRASEHFGNVFDYVSTQIRLYLPFIGIVPLDTADVMRGTVSVIYHVDVLSGACLAEVKVTRDNSGGTIYQFSGDCAVRYPISSGSYMGMVTGVLSVVGGIGSAIMSGGATLPLAIGTTAHGLNSMHTNVQHSGSFSGCAGAMGIKKPYLIYSRPQTALANNFGHYQGYPANQSVSVGSMSGYFKMADVHLENIATATESELTEIETLLLEGVVA